MRRILGSLGLATATTISMHALACGGGYGDQVTIKPTQTIGVVYRSGEETYIFEPHFCGAATEFGLILPVPAPLTKNPTLTDSTLFDQLEVIAAPTVETIEVCAQNSFLGSGSSKATDRSSDQSNGDGVNVVSSGTVGQFQWELLKADSTQSFTDWLDTNHFTYTSTDAFAHYVQAGWYFVAFRVATGSSAPPAGYRLCGDFGPIQLSFQTPQATIPVRIATANDPSNYFYWRVMTLSNHEQTLTGSGSDYLSTTLAYAGTLSTSDLASAPAVAGIANAGDWLTAYDVNFGGYFADDIVMAQAGADTAFRDHQYKYKEVNCGVFGCSIDPHARRIPLTLALVTLGSVLLFALRRR